MCNSTLDLGTTELRHTRVRVFVNLEMTGLCKISLSMEELLDKNICQG